MQTIAILEAENQELKARVRELEAQCAVMREVLDKAAAALLVAYSMDCGFKDCYSRTGISNHSRCGAHESINNACLKVRNALSADADREMLVRVRKLEAVAEAAKEYRHKARLSSSLFDYGTNIKLQNKLNQALAALEEVDSDG